MFARMFFLRKRMAPFPEKILFVFDSFAAASESQAIIAYFFGREAQVLHFGEDLLRFIHADSGVFLATTGAFDASIRPEHLEKKHGISFVR